MNVTRLTITPIYRDCPTIVVKNPTVETAKLLMTERLSSGSSKLNSRSVPVRALRKLPEALKGFVNPLTMAAKKTN